MIQQRIEKLVRDAVDLSRDDGVFAFEGEIEVEISVPRAGAHGDFATSVALALAGRAGKKPRELADAIVARIRKGAPEIESVAIAGPGFINFVVRPGFYLEVLHEIHAAGDKFGRLDIGKGKKLQVEFVSANPTGPLHIGHGRGAVYGDVLGNVMAAAGYEVTKEYYVNDAGGQIRTLGRSVWLRMKELRGERIEFPQECYQGHYIVDIARELKVARHSKLESMNEDEAIEFCGELAGDRILAEIKRDLAETGVIHDTYFFEQKLHTGSDVESAINYLKSRGHIYEQDGALWFRSTAFGDDKDRVLKKGDGQLTYFAADIAYHKNKYERGFDRVIDVWGADHGGYVARMKAAVEALGYDAASFDAVLIQLVNLVRGGEAVSMSTRSATYETLEDVRRDVGRDACRYFFLMRSHNAQLDFDLELARKTTPDNPVFYIQYAHARICSIFRKAAEQELYPPESSDVDVSLLNLPEEPKLARMLCDYPGIIGECALELEPHKLAFYLLELARMFQSYYSKGRADSRYMVVSDDGPRARAKLYLLKNLQIVLQNGLKILGVSAPPEMSREEEDV
ncbi:MAG: arginine--tRNA ligase [Pseudomonadota bacterium]